MYPNGIGDHIGAQPWIWYRRRPPIPGKSSMRLLQEKKIPRSRVFQGHIHPRYLPLAQQYGGGYDHRRNPNHYHQLRPYLGGNPQQNIVFKRQKKKKGLNKNCQTKIIENSSSSLSLSLSLPLSSFTFSKADAVIILHISPSFALSLSLSRPTC